jgi:hypothetical protein
MSDYKTTAEILNAVFAGDALSTVYKTDAEVLNLVYDPEANALKVNIEGFSGGGTGGESIIDGEVSTYAELPPASEHAGEIYIVSTTTGIPLINRRQAGMYRSDGVAWTLLDVDLQADKVYYSGALTAANVADALDELAGGMNSKFEAVTTGSGTLYLSDDGTYKAVESGGGGEVNVQPDWNEANTESDAYILNKPTIPTALSQLSNDAGFISGYTVTEMDVTQHQGALTITESQISDFGTYEPADATILRDADIGVNVQAYNANTVSDASYVHTDNNYTTAEKDKLAGIEAGATENSSDATLLDRTNHTGTQAISTIADLQATLDAKFEATVTGSGTLFLSDDGVYNEASGGGTVVDITSSEFNAGYKRGGKQVYGVEVDVGALPNAANKTAVIPGYNASYVYWFAVGSYARNTATTAAIPLPYQSLNPVFIWKRTDNLIAVNTSSDMSAYNDTKIILNYTKD